MSNTLKRMLALMALTTFLCLGNFAWAEDVSMPTSENPASVKWTKMTIGTFSADPSIMFTQCDKQAAFNESDRLTPAHCAELREKYGKGDYTVVWVKDGIVHDLMGARVNGQSKVVQLTEKTLGRADRALRFRLSGEIDGYWYTGEKGKSCNNFAVTFLSVPKPAAPPPVNGMCGDNARQFAAGTTRFPSELALAFCRVGRLVKAPDPLVPGVESRWVCEGANGGSAQQCVATVATAPVVVTLPPVAEAIPGCRWVEDRPVVTISHGSYSSTPGLTVSACGVTVSLQGTSSHVPASSIVTGGRTLVCSPTK